MVCGPAHGPRVDVVQLTAGARARALVTLAVLKEVLLAMPHPLVFLLRIPLLVAPGLGNKQDSSIWNLHTIIYMEYSWNILTIFQNQAYARNIPGIYVHTQKLVLHWFQALNALRM